MDKAGKAARLKLTPIKDRGTDCRLRARLKTVIEPGDILEARATKKKPTKLTTERARVRGTERRAVSLTTGQFIFLVNFGLMEELKTNIACKEKWSKAPNMTPITTPVTSSGLTKKTIPTIIPKLYRSGLSEYKINLFSY